MHSPLRHSDQQKKQREDLGPFPCEIAIAWIPGTCECSDEDDSYGMKTIRNVLDVNHDARWGLRTRKRTEQLNGQRTRQNRIRPATASNPKRTQTRQVSNLTWGKSSVMVDAWVATLAERGRYIKHSNTQRKNVASSVENAEDVIVKLNMEYGSLRIPKGAGCTERYLVRRVRIPAYE